ncbi:ABC transporter ATP-binding protein [Natronolimnobius sp. AArcel1]|uniref:ABC transporter ATP-binding protein n=1 Tax=Natronolimnobius sp. AArcel1 TaxID=1679093 RepID=UPI0013EAB7A7|nr:ABC transporter ATP-binding protein [Natronolimnobius sp. AArcel1]NGM70368.1 ABC transporter ATP-binding protein [Natronolimnobius sp. AArcel1]
MLEINDLKTYYETDDGKFVHAVDGVSINVEEQETLGLVGESGCGKTTLAKSIIRLLPRNGEVVDGEVSLHGKEITEMSDKELRQEIRWTEISMIPQTAMNGFDPVKTVGKQIVDVIRRHEDTPKAEARERAKELFENLGLEGSRIDDYPHQFSGGMAQRAMIAMALALSPSIILADEPTTALDVMIQDRILRQIDELQEEFETAMIMITHDMSVVSENCDKIAVMYGGRVAEYADARTVIKQPRHPYTMGMRNAFPDISQDSQDLISIPGTPPEVTDPDEGCRFAPRCPFAEDDCWDVTPEPEEYDGQVVRCHRSDEAEELRELAKKKETWMDEPAEAESSESDDRRGDTLTEVNDD